MIKTKCLSSSLWICFASVFLFSALFAARCFIFLYLQPLQSNGTYDHIDVLKLVSSLPIPNPMTVMEAGIHQNDESASLPSSTPIVENPVSSNSRVDLKPKPPVAEGLFKPPSDLSAEERMAWFKERVPRMEIFESTEHTRMFDERIEEFFEGCKVRFFMTWISPWRLFGKREMFSLESVLKANPEGCVVIVSRNMDSEQGRDLLHPLVKLGHKVLPVSPDLSLLFDNTPAGPWLEGIKAGESDPGKIPITQNLSNLLRLVLLYKYGGVYLDVDVIVLKDFSDLRNCIGIEVMDRSGKTWETLNNAVLIFDRKHPLLLKLIEEFTAQFNGSIWGHNGPSMVSRVIRKVASNDSAYNLNVLSATAFYPVRWRDISKYFKTPKNEEEMQWTHDQNAILNKQSYAMHFWNRVSRGMKIEEHSLFGRIISEHCIICKDIYPTHSTSTSS